MKNQPLRHPVGRKKERFESDYVCLGVTKYLRKLVIGNYFMSLKTTAQILCVLTCGVAYATNWNENDSFWVTYAYPKVSSDKDITNVYVHTGVLRDGGDTCGFAVEPKAGSWDNVQHLKMTKTNDHFFTKLRLDSHTGQCQVGVKGPMVQYWVYFSDGTMTITDPVAIPFEDTQKLVYQLGPNGNTTDALDWNKSVTVNDQLLDNLKDAATTAATRLQYRWAD